MAKRGQVLSWFYMAIPVGSTMGYVLGGYVAAVNRNAQSWRWAFYAVVIPGLLLGLWSLSMREPHHGHPRISPPCPSAADNGRTTARFWKRLLRALHAGDDGHDLRRRALGWWMADYLHLHKVPWVWGKIEPVAFFGLVTAVAGVLGTLAGGVVGDACRTRWPGSYFLVSGAAMLACVPCALLFLVVPFPWAWGFVFVAEFLLFFNTGPTNTILANVVHPSIRSTGFALNIFIIHTLGDAISPPLVGAVADRFHSLSTDSSPSRCSFSSAACFGSWGRGIRSQHCRRPATIEVHRSVMAPRNAVAGLSPVPNPQSLIPPHVPRH